jgi:hypothetical protein
MLNPLISSEVGNVLVHTTHNRGHSAEELAEMALDKIIYVGEGVPEPIRAQALAYREKIRSILVFYMRQAILSERTTIRAELTTELKDTL